jgi:hypothetical protein
VKPKPSRKNMRLFKEKRMISRRFYKIVRVKKEVSLDLNKVIYVVTHSVQIALTTFSIG